MTAAFTFCAAVSVLSACALLTSDSPSLSQEELEIPACRSDEPIRVVTLASSGTVTCDISGSELVFPDGERLDAPPTGTGSTRGHDGSKRYYVQNFGVYGVVAGVVSRDRESGDWWGTPTGVDYMARVYSATPLPGIRP